jgi:predicted outer membrane repeat protein
MSILGLSSNKVRPLQHRSKRLRVESLEERRLLAAAPPVITSIQRAFSGTDTFIVGQLNDTPSTEYRVELFVSDDDQPDGAGETSLGFVDVTTNPAGNVAFNFTASEVIPAGRFVSARATDPDDETSPFSNALGSLIITHTDDGGLGSLREAIIRANANPGLDRISLSAGTYTLTIPGADEDAAATGDLDITDDLSINGAGTTIIQAGATTAKGIDRVLHILDGLDGPTDVSLERITIQNGNTQFDGGGIFHAGTGALAGAFIALINNHAGGSGGAIRALAGAVGLGFVNVLNNTANGDGGGIRTTSGSITCTDNSVLSGNNAGGHGGGICTDSGTVTLEQTTIRENIADGGGGGIYTQDGPVAFSESSILDNTAGGDGGGIHSLSGGITGNGTPFGVSLFLVVISGNVSSGDGGGIYTQSGTVELTVGLLAGNSARNGGGIHTETASIDLNRSTVRDNVVTGNGGGIHTAGGAVTLTNSTISVNLADESGGGIYTTGDASLSLSFATVANNTADNNDDGAGDGGGVFDDTVMFSAGNSIFGDNTDRGGQAPEIAGALNSQGYNLMEDISGAVINGNTTGNILGQDPLLKALTSNKTSTDLVHALLEGSPALHGANPAVFLVTDQRQVPRPQGPAPDIGSYESIELTQAEIRIDNVTVTEGDSGFVNAVFAVTLSTPKSGVTVTYATSSFVPFPATPATFADYWPMAGTLSFNAATTQFITVRVIGDLLNERDEGFVINLSASGATLAVSQAIATILNDDPLPSIEIDEVSVVETNQGTTQAVFTVSISAPSGLPVSVAFETGDGTAGSADYLATMGVLSFAPGDTRRQITVQVVGEPINESDETFRVNLTDAGNATIADGEGTGSIVNDDFRIVVTAPGAGYEPRIRVFDVNSQDGQIDFKAYPADFTGGVTVAAGDINGDGRPDVITAPGRGGGPQVRVFDGRTGQRLPGPLGSFFAFSSSFTGGVFVASSDVNGDGRDDIIAAAGPGGGPQVRVFSGADGTRLMGFFAYPNTFTRGVCVAAGDINGDGRGDIITGPVTGAEQVKVFSGDDATEIRSFFPYGGAFGGGIHVAAGDVNGDGPEDIITGPGRGGGPQVRVFSGEDGTRLTSFFAFNSNFTGGVRVASADVNGDGNDDIIVGAGPGGGPQMRIFRGGDLARLGSLFPYSVDFSGGIFVAGAPHGARTDAASQRIQPTALTSANLLSLERVPAAVQERQAIGVSDEKIDRLRQAGLEIEGSSGPLSGATFGLEHEDVVDLLTDLLLSELRGT